MTAQRALITSQFIPVLTGVNKERLHMGQGVTMRYSILHSVAFGGGLACGRTYMLMTIDVYLSLSASPGRGLSIYGAVYSLAYPGLVLSRAVVDALIHLRCWREFELLVSGRLLMIEFSEAVPNRWRRTPKWDASAVCRSLLSE